MRSKVTRSFLNLLSRFVVLENTRPTNNLTGQMLETANIKYRGSDGLYRAFQDTLVNEPEAKGEIRSDVRQAKVSLMLAERVDAPRYAPEEYGKAQAAWQKTVNAAEAGVDKKILMSYGHETVRLAVEAEKRAKERAFQTALDNERKANIDQLSELKASIEKAETEADRAALKAKQKEMELAMETAARNKAQQQAEEAARRAETAEAKARMAEQQVQQLASQQMKAQSEAAQARSLAEEARLKAAQAQKDRDAARAQMREALSAVVETRETARGLIVNLPDILFDFNKDQLKPEAKEKLSKVCGILSVVGDYNLSIEGHTDSKGTDDYNQKLSERRAENVMTYLAGCGLSQAKLSSLGFGKTQPITTNDTAEGRQKNRRVEIVISEAGAINKLNN